MDCATDRCSAAPAIAACPLLSAGVRFAQRRLPTSTQTARPAPSCMRSTAQSINAHRRRSHPPDLEDNDRSVWMIAGCSRRRSRLCRRGRRRPKNHAEARRCSDHRVDAGRPCQASAKGVVRRPRRIRHQANGFRSLARKKTNQLRSGSAPVSDRNGTARRSRRPCAMWRRGRRCAASYSRRDGDGPLLSR